MAGLTKMKDVGWGGLPEPVRFCNDYVVADELFIQCLYETQYVHFFKSKFGRRKVKFRNTHHMSKNDAFALGYCIANSSSAWDIKVSNSPGLSFEMLRYGLKCAAAAGGYINSLTFSNCYGIINEREHLIFSKPICQHIKSLSFLKCDINESGLSSLAKCLPSLHSLTSLELIENRRIAGAEIKNLLQALIDHGKLKLLWLEDTDFTFRLAAIASIPDS